MNDQSESATEQFARMMMAAAVSLVLVTVPLWGPVVKKGHDLWKWYHAR